MGNVDAVGPEPVTFDFDNNGFDDLVVGTGIYTGIRYLPGGPDGLSAGRITEIESGAITGNLVIGDFNGDSYRDVLATNTDSQDVTYVEGGDDGLSAGRRRNIPVRGGPWPNAPPDGHS